MVNHNSGLNDLRDKIKDTPITSVVGNYIAITHRGQNAVAVCPFHDDHHPLFKRKRPKRSF